MQDGWGWGASLLNPFSGSNDPMSLFGLGDSTPASGPAPGQDFFGMVSPTPEEQASAAEPASEQATSMVQPPDGPEQASHQQALLSRANLEWDGPACHCRSETTPGARQHGLCTP